MDAGTDGFLGVNTNPTRKVVVLGGRSDPVLGPAGWAEKTVVDGKAVRVEGSKWLLDSQSGDGHGGNMQVQVQGGIALLVNVYGNGLFQ